MWKLLQEAQKALGDAQSRLVIVRNRIDQVDRYGSENEHLAAEKAVETLEEEITKAVKALEEVESKFKMRDTYGGRSVHCVQAGDNGAPSPPPTKEPGGDERAGESSPNVSPVPRPVPRPSRSPGNERRAPDTTGGRCAKVDFSLSQASFRYGRIAGLRT